MPPALLIFIVGPGGPRPLKGYWQTRPRTLFEGLFSSPTTPLIQHLGQGPRGPWMWENRVNRRALVPRGPTWCQWILTTTSRDLSPERSMRLAGRDGVGWISRKGAAQKTGEEGLLVCTDSPEPVYTLSVLSRLPGGGGGQPCPQDLPGLACDANGKTKAGLGPAVPPALLELLWEAAQRLPS